MIKIAKNRAYALEDLFESLTDSGAISCFEGLMGTAFADDESTPDCCCIHLGEYLYVGGNADSKAFLKEVFEYSIDNSLTVITLNENIKQFASQIYGDKCTFSTRYQMGCELETKNSHLFNNINNLSEEFELAKIDENIYQQCLKNDWSEYFCKNFKNYDEFSQNAFGYAILKNGKIVGGTSSYSYYSKGFEVIVATAPEYRRKGLALVSSSAFVLECLRVEKFPHWDAANTKSLALSKKLGYTLFREYQGLKIEK